MFNFLFFESFDGIMFVSLTFNFGSPVVPCFKRPCPVLAGLMRHGVLFVLAAYQANLRTWRMLGVYVLHSV